MLSSRREAAGGWSAETGISLQACAVPSYAPQGVARQKLAPGADIPNPAAMPHLSTAAFPATLHWIAVLQPASPSPGLLMRIGSGLPYAQLDAPTRHLQCNRWCARSQPQMRASCVFARVLLLCYLRVASGPLMADARLLHRLPVLARRLAGAARGARLCTPAIANRSVPAACGAHPLIDCDRVAGHLGGVEA